MYSIYDHHEEGNTILATANSSGIAQGFLGPCPAGYQWYVERYTNFSNTAKSAPMWELFSIPEQALPGSYTATAGSRSGRQDVTTVLNSTADNHAAVIVPENYFLVLFVTGLTSGDVVELSTQLCVHQLVPILSTPQDAAAMALQHASAHEHVMLSHEVVGDLAV